MHTVGYDLSQLPPFGGFNFRLAPFFLTLNEPLTSLPSTEKEYVYDPCLTSFEEMPGPAQNV